MLVGHIRTERPFRWRRSRPHLRARWRRRARSAGPGGRRWRQRRRLLRVADAARAVCGDGSDTVSWEGESALRAGPWVSRSCERISVGEAGSAETELFIRPPRPITATRDGRFVFRVPCLAFKSCRQRLTITDPRAPFRRLGSRRFVTPQAGRRIVVRIPPELVDAARRRPLRLRVRLDGVIAFGNTPEDWVSIVWRFDLNAPRPATPPPRAGGREPSDRHPNRPGSRGASA